MPALAPSLRRLRALALAALALAPSAARAQVETEGSALDQLHPAPAGDRFFAIQSAESEGHLRLKGMLLAEYAREPLVLSTRGADGEDEELGAIVSDQLYLHVGLTLPLYNRVGLSIDAPITLVNTGDDVVSNGQTLAAPSGFSMGDLRAGARLRVLGIGPLQVAVAGYLWLPTGDQGELTGAGSVRGSPQLVVSGKVSNVAYAVNAGAIFGPTATYAGTTVGHQLVLGAAAGLLAFRQRLQIGPELYGNAEVSGDDAFAGETTNLELLLGARYRAGPLLVGGGIGPGLAAGMGTPILRVLASVAYAPLAEDRDSDGIFDEDDACADRPGNKHTDPRKHGCPEEIGDRDKDGVADTEDACPDQPGPRTDSAETNGCPDRDEDAVADARDACPTEAGARSTDPKKNGCPPDRDGDGVADRADACPDRPGAPAEARRRNGCPPDRDGDRIVDPDDACPDLPGVKHADAAKNGCPRDSDDDGIIDDVDACRRDKGSADPDPAKNGCPTVFVTATAVVMREQVQFQPGKDAILPESEALLTAIAEVLLAHPEITKVSIQAHTEGVGKKAENQNLSTRRAASLKKWLVTRGKVDAKRLESKGFGMDRPIDSNDTEEGRQKNRRIEIEILEQSKPPAIKPSLPRPPPPAPPPASPSAPPAPPPAPVLPSPSGAPTKP